MLGDLVAVVRIALDRLETREVLGRGAADTLAIDLRIRPPAPAVP